MFYRNEKCAPERVNFSENFSDLIVNFALFRNS